MSEIPNGLRADIMRKRMLDKNTLSSAGSLYCKNDVITLPQSSAKILENSLDTIYYLYCGIFPLENRIQWNDTVINTQKADNTIGILSDQWHAISNPYVLDFDKRSTLILRTQYQETIYETIIDWGELAPSYSDINYITYLTGYGYCYLDYDPAAEQDNMPPYSIIIPESLRTNLSIVGYKILY